MNSVQDCTCVRKLQVNEKKLDKPLGFLKTALVHMLGLHAGIFPYFELDSCHAYIVAIGRRKAFLAFPRPPPPPPPDAHAHSIPGRTD